MFSNVTSSIDDHGTFSPHATNVHHQLSHAKGQVFFNNKTTPFYLISMLTTPQWPVWLIPGTLWTRASFSLDVWLLFKVQMIAVDFWHISDISHCDRQVTYST
jgi:hypothetical protein